MDKSFKIGFEKIAISLGSTQKYWKKGTDFAASVAKKRVAAKAGRDAQRAAIQASYGGSANQASKIRLAPKSKPLNVDAPAEKLKSAQDNVSAIFGTPKKVKK